MAKKFADLNWVDFNLLVMCVVIVAVGKDGCKWRESGFQMKELKSVACGILAAVVVTAASPVVAANQVRIINFFLSLTFNCTPFKLS